jgi:hypothetical protein
MWCHPVVQASTEIGDQVLMVWWKAFVPDCISTNNQRSNQCAKYFNGGGECEQAGHRRDDNCFYCHLHLKGPALILDSPL